MYSKAEVKRLTEAGRQELADEVKILVKLMDMDMISIPIMKMAVTGLSKWKVQQLMIRAASFT